jgi:hypothetical protein
LIAYWEGAVAGGSCGGGTAEEGEVRGGHFYPVFNDVVEAVGVIAGLRG